LDVAFGDFKLDSEGRRLLRGGQYVHLSRRAYELLELLVLSRPRAFSKSELQAKLWPDSFVVEANLSNLVAEIRSALGDDRRNPRYIRTVHGFGYAFSGEASGGEPARGPAAARGVPDSLCWLIAAERRVQLAEGEHFLGRHPGSILAFDSPAVSRHHASIRVTADGAVIEDLGSRNGTFVRGQRIGEPTRLEDGDEIKLGSVLLEFRVAEDPPTIELGGQPTGDDE
jgi:DNA-binding winged helix-turn-helix (wHTH) protein